MSETETLGQPGDNTVASDAEARARRLGWVAKEEFKGDPDKHRSAEEFLERGETMLPLLKRDNDRLHDGMTKLERRLEDQAKTFAQFAEYATKAEERAYKKAKAELEAKRDTAIETADVNAARQAQREIDQLEAPVAPKVETKKDEPQLDPVIQTWIGENEWFNKSQSLRAYSTEVFGDLERQYPGKSKSELLAETKQKTMERFPDKFGINPKREGASAVNEPSANAQTRKKPGRTYDDLPPEAKKACDKFVRTIPKYTREDYCKNYEWDS
jgi:hypothetical protein